MASAYSSTTASIPRLTIRQESHRKIEKQRPVALLSAAIEFFLKELFNVSIMDTIDVRDYKIPNSPAIDWTTRRVKFFQIDIQWYGAGVVIIGRPTRQSLGHMT